VVLCLIESLLSLKKNRLLASIDAAFLASVPNSSAASDSSRNDDVGNQETLNMDAEFAAFQVLANFFYSEIYSCA